MALQMRRVPSIKTRVTLSVMMVFALVAQPLYGALSAQIASALAGNVVINEIVANPSDGIEWVELYNPTAAAIDISHWQVRDNANFGNIPADTILNSNSFYVVENSTSSKLSNAGETVTLVKQQANEVVDTVQYPALGTGSSYARIYDASSDLEVRQMAAVTKNASNGAAPVVVAEVNPEEFITVDGPYKGVSVGFNVKNFGTVSAVSVDVERADGSHVIKHANQGVLAIASNKTTPTKLTAPIVIQEGSFKETDDSQYWNPALALWNTSTRPVKATISVTDENGTKTTVNDVFRDGTPSWPDYESLLPPVPSTVTVKSNTAAGENQSGWMFNRDATTSTPFEFSTSAKSLGNGSLYVKPIGSANPKDKFVAELFDKTPVSAFNSFAYDFQIGNSGGASDADQFYLNVYANVDDSNKFYDCRYDYVPNSGALGSFTTVNFTKTSLPTHVQKSSSSRLASCPATLAGMPNGSHIRAFALSVGDTGASDAGLSGYLDNVKVSKSDAITIYDFEPDTTSPNIPTGGQPHDSFKAINNFYFEWNAATDDSGLPVTYEFQSSQSPSQSGGVLNSGVWHNSQGTPEQQNLTSPKIHSVGANGKWYWQVRAVDAAGNKSAWSQIWSMTIDMEKPAAPTIITPTNGQYFKATPIQNKWTAVSDASGIANYEVEYIYDDGHTFANGPTRLVAGNQTTRSHQPSVGEQGGVTIRVRAIDGAGNVGEYSAPVHYYYDAQAPTISLQQPQNGDRFKKDQQFTVSAHLTDNIGLANYHLQIDGVEPSHGNVNDQAQTLVSGGVELDIHTIFNANDFTNGNHTITAWVIDKAGHESQKITRTIWIDKTPPTVTVKPESEGSNDHFRKVSFKLSDNDKVVKYFINGIEKTVTPNKWSDANGIAIGKNGGKLGENIFTLVDATGNTTTYTFWLDIVAPTGDVTTSNDNGNTFTANDVTAVLTTNEAIKTPEGWSKVDDVTFTKIHFENGTFTVVIEDFASNSKTIEYEVKRIDKTNPVINGVNSDGLYNGPVSFTAVEENIQEIIVDGVSYNEGNAPYTVSGDGGHTVEVVDKAGNRGSVQFTIDTLAPRLTINTPILNRDGTYTLSGTTDDPASEVEVKLDDTVLTDVVWNTAHTEWSVTTDILAIGSTHTITVRNWDAANNPVTISTGFTVPPVPSTPLATSITDSLSTPFPVPRALGVLPSTFNNPAAQDDTAVLGAQTEKNPTVDQNAKNAAIAATDKGWKLFGLLWYWWLLLGVLIAAIAWGVTAFARRRVAEDI